MSTRDFDIQAATGHTTLAPTYQRTNLVGTTGEAFEKILLNRLPRDCAEGVTVLTQTQRGVAGGQSR